MTVRELEPSKQPLAPRHPTSFELERWHSGERFEAEGSGIFGIAQHVQGCTECQARLHTLEHHRQQFLAQRDPAEFVRALRAAEGMSRVPHREPRTWARWAGGGLSLAAAVFGVCVLFLRAHDPERAPTALSAAFEARDLVFKGSDRVTIPADTLAPLPRVEVIRNRGGLQSLIGGTVEITAGDELRAVVHVAQASRLSGVIQTDQGEWLPLFSDWFEPGTYSPASGLRVDERPGSAQLRVGSPADLARLREAGDASRVTTVALVWADP
jgi:hypothetical protein